MMKNNKLILLFKDFYSYILFKLYRQRYSVLPQEGENAILRRFFSRKKGFYIDVGAHHPIRFSNTLMLYKFGWNGINIEPNYSNYKKFLRNRERDINLNYAVSNKKDTFYYEYLETALNTISEKTVNFRSKLGIQYINKRSVMCMTLENILNKFCIKKEIDFLNIDTEGSELEILKTNNWNKFIPKVIFCEILNHDLEQVLKNKITIFLKLKGYKIFAKLFNNVVFVHRNYYKKFNNS